MITNKVAVNTISEKPEFKRVIGKIEGVKPGPTLIFVGGIHGNEPSGVYALKEVFKSLENKKNKLQGTVIALAGNLNALQNNVRFISKDLNRLFTKKNIEALNEVTFPKFEEENEQIALLNEIKSILNSEAAPFYFFDLHTTSSETIPFLTVNDSLLNRKFTKQYPLPIVLGIEEYLEGPLLSYINKLGYVAFGFEAGQHTAEASIKNHIAFIYASLLYTGCLSEIDEETNKALETLKTSNQQNHQFYEIIYRQQIEDNEAFKMKGGFKNFQKIKKHQSIANNNLVKINAPYSGHIFMPLYQGKGNDGFFIVRKIPRLFLGLSKWFRNVKLDHLIVLLPGVHWKSKNKESLIVDLRIARFFTKQFFHLMGYRNKVKDSNYLIVKNRESASKTNMYKKEKWF